MKSTIAVFLLLISTCVLAGEGSGVPTGVMAHEGNLFIFKTPVHTGSPACNKYGWAVSLSTESGKAMFSLVLAAKAQDKAIAVKGKADCLDWSDRETPKYIYIKD